MLVRRKHHRPSKLAKKRRKILLFKIGGIVFVVALLVTGLIFALRAERINIVDIEIKGNSAIAAKTLKNFAEREISGNYLFVLPKSSIILYPKKGMEEAFLENFKEIKEVNISFESLQSISVNIQERKPYALYCSATTTDCYFLDEDGFIFTKAPDFSGNVFLRYFGAIEDGSIIGQQFLTKENFREINFFLSSLLEIGLNPISFSMLNDDDNEILLEEGGKILFGQKQNLSNIYDNIQSVFDSDEFDRENLRALDYADFRFGNKVYFKFK